MRAFENKAKIFYTAISDKIVYLNTNNKYIQKQSIIKNNYLNNPNNPISMYMKIICISFKLHRFYTVLLEILNYMFRLYNKQRTVFNKIIDRPQKN